MSRRGFSGRGSSFRGRGDWNDSSSRGRGFSGPSRGRFNWYKEASSSSFDSRRYGSGGGDRYSSRGRGDDGGYRRYSRMDGPGYSPRDHRDHRSPESQRKRMRTEHGYVQGSSSRRSHEGSYGGGGDYNNRYNYEEKGSYGDERGRAYREERRSGSGFRDRSREDYAHRKADHLDSGMPPPSAPSRHLSSPRGSFRGRVRGRGVSRLIFSRRADSMLVRKKIMDSSYSFRKRMLASRAAESLRILKLQRLRRIRAAVKTKKDTDKDGSKATEDISEDEKEENWDEEAEKGEEDEELEEGETPDKKEKVKAKKEKKETSEAKKDKEKDEEREEGEEVDDEEEEEEEEEEAGSGASTPKKSDAKNELHDSDVRDVSEEGRKRPSRTLSGRPFIRLTCPHCYVRCVTFKEYTMHLYTSKHINMMRKQSLRHKQTLARMRMNQRHKQRILEENEEAHGSLAPRSSFCPICKLNYRQLKAKHQASESHRAMKKFLMPYCRVCRVGFKSPMLYENHICSLDHLKRKARLEERMLHERDRDSQEGGSGDEDREINMDNFMILDSVGTVDDSGDEAEGEEGKSKGDKDKEEGKEKTKTEIKLGSEYIKKVEVYFCDLCRLYLPRLDPPERALSIHCRTRNHLQRYVRYRDDRALRSKAEKIHHRREKENAAKEAEKKNAESKKEENEKKGESSSEKEGATKEATASSDSNKKNSTAEGSAKTSQQEGHDTSAETVGDGGGEGEGDLDQDLEGGMDDKLWADVDKDLGELLREVEPGNKSSDEDDDSRAEGGRYDRFRYSEKGSIAEDASAEGDANETNAKPNTNGEAEKKSEVTKNSKENANAKPSGEEAPKKQATNNAAASSPPSAAASS